jgi:protein-tyrosine phosphatase
MAEAIFQQMVDDAGLSHVVEVDSAGTGTWYIGEQAHPGTRRILARHDISYDGRARQIRQEDGADPDTYLITMDESNMKDVRALLGDHPRLYRLLDFADQNSVRDVPDPYYTGNFEYVYQLVEQGCRGLLAEVRRQEKI